MITVRRLLEKKGSDIWSIPPHATVFEALGLMAEKNVGAVLVMAVPAYGFGKGLRGRLEAFRAREVEVGPLVLELGAVLQRDFEADALVFHLNPLQEALQPEGQCDFTRLVDKMAAVVAELEVPVIAKEIGWRNWAYIDELDFDTFPEVGHPFADYWGIWVERECRYGDETTECCFDMGGCEDGRTYPPPRQTAPDKARDDLDPSLAWARRGARRSQVPSRVGRPGARCLLPQRHRLRCS